MRRRNNFTAEQYDRIKSRPIEDSNAYDLNEITCSDLKVQLGLIKKVKPKKDNPLAPYVQLKRQPELYKRGKNCWFNAKTLQAYSYGWWRFVEKVGPYIVFNNYRYSHTTTTHQWDTLSLLDALKIKIDYHVQCRQGLQSYDSSIDDHTYQIKQLKEVIKKPRTHKVKNTERKIQIEELKAKIKTLKMLNALKKASNT